MNQCGPSGKLAWGKHKREASHERYNGVNETAEEKERGVQKHAPQDLYKVEGKAELVNGEIVHPPPTGDDPGRVSLNVAVSLRTYKTQIGQGQAYGDGVGFHM